jgi:adhesin transport system membrane fusion protein
MKFLKQKKNKPLSARDAAWMSDIQEALFSQTTPKSRLVLWLILAVFIGFLT